MAAQYSINELKKGVNIELDGVPYKIVDCEINHPGKGPCVTITKIKSYITGNVIPRTFRETDKIDRPNLETKTMEYLYSEGDHYVFMDQTTYEQEYIDKKNIEWESNFLKENSPADVLFYNGRPISIEIETFVILTVTKSDPGVKGNTAQNCTKPATLETGYTTQVPLYIEEGEKVKIDTRTGEFVERAK